MKVGFDISQVAHKGGVAIYTQNLAEKLQQFNDLEMITNTKFLCFFLKDLSSNIFIFFVKRFINEGAL